MNRPNLVSRPVFPGRNRRPARPLATPSRPSFSDRDEERPFARTEIQDADVAVDDGRSAIAPDVRLPAEVATPKFLAIEVVAKKPGGRERSDHALTVGHEIGRASCRERV